VVDENTVQDETAQETPAAPIVKAPPVESRFLFVDIAALRAKQLRRGARVRLPEDFEQPRKPERVAMEEVRQCLVQYDIPERTVEPPAEE
jgi:DNA-directed RNA polymerase subunit K/omega